MFEELLLASVPEHSPFRRRSSSRKVFHMVTEAFVVLANRVDLRFRALIVGVLVVHNLLEHLDFQHGFPAVRGFTFWCEVECASLFKLCSFCWINNSETENTFRLVWLSLLRDAQHFLVSKTSFGAGGRRVELISEWSYQESVNYANEVERN